MKFREPLTPAEEEALPYIAAGFTNERAGELLGIRPKTVDGRRQGVYNKFRPDARMSGLPIALEYAKETLMCAECYPTGNFTHTERMLLNCFSRGMDYAKASETLGISEKTLGCHRDNIYKKFWFTPGVNKRIALYLYCRTVGTFHGETVTLPEPRVLQEA